MEETKTERRCRACNHAVDFMDTAEAERFTTSSRWTEENGLWTCPVCVATLAAGYTPTKVHRDHPEMKRAPRIYIPREHHTRKAPLA